MICIKKWALLLLFFQAFSLNSAQAGWFEKLKSYITPQNAKNLAYVSALTLIPGAAGADSLSGKETTGLFIIAQRLCGELTAACTWIGGPIAYNVGNSTALACDMDPNGFFYQTCSQAGFLKHSYLREVASAAGNLVPSEMIVAAGTFLVLYQTGAIDADQLVEGCKKGAGLCFSAYQKAKQILEPFAREDQDLAAALAVEEKTE